MVCGNLMGSGLLLGMDNRGGKKKNHSCKELWEILIELTDTKEKKEEKY